MKTEQNNNNVCYIQLQNAILTLAYFRFRTSLKGSALYLGPDLFSIFHQLGIADEIIEQSKPCHSIDVYGEDRQRQFKIDFNLLREM